MVLTGQQKAAVECPRERICVLAGPGTGKTTVLTHRIARLIRERGVRPEGICALTFTRSAASEMRARIELLAPEARGRAAVRTFHSLAYRLLRRLIPDLRVISPPEQMRLLRELCPEELDPRWVRREISRARNRLLDPRDLSPEIGRIWEEYERRKEGLDYDDLLLLLLEVLREDGRELREGIAHLLVDEFQDLSPLQYEIVRELARGREVFVVGDPLQCIYEWRASSPEMMDRFVEEFDPQVIHLTENFRSRRRIIEAANRILEVISPGRPPLEGILGEEGTVLIELFPREEEEIRGLIEAVSGEQDLSECAVLVRTNDQIGQIERAAAPRGLSVSKEYSVFGRKEARFTLDLLRLILDPELNHQAIPRIAPLIDPYLGRRFREELRETAKRHKVTLYQALKGTFSRPYLAVGARRILEAIERFHGLAQRLSPPELLLRLREELELDRFLELRFSDEEDELSGEPSAVLDRLAATSEGFGSLEEFLAWAETPKRRTLNVTTVHRAKGLEFRKVFVPFLRSGCFPVSDSPEEWRLFYVAVTRARDSLILTSIRDAESPFLLVLNPEKEPPKGRGLLGRLGSFFRRGGRALAAI